MVIRKVFAAGALCFVSHLACAQVSSDKACAVWATFGHTMAEARDSGAPEQEQRKKIDGINKSDRGFTKENAEYAKAILRMVYHDFRAKTPTEISSLMHITCKLTSP